MNEMKAHRRFIAAAKGEPVDRLPVLEWATLWDLTLNRWRAEKPELEGMPDWEIMQHFGLDLHLQSWFRPTSAATPKPKSHGAPVVIDEAGYLAIRDTLYPMPDLDDSFWKLANRMHDEGTGVVWFTLEGFFWFPRVLLGIENHLFSFYDQPDLYRRICDDLLAWHKKVLAYCAERFDYDFMTFAEDMSYNHGPMIGRDLFDEFMLPYYREIVPLVKKNDILTVVDSDGDITKAVDWFRAGGVEGMLPLERQAGVDVSVYIEKHPDMFFLGHFDKTVMHKGEEAMRAEFERLLPSLVKGRVIPSVDHQTPPAVSYEDYTIYCRLLKEYAARAARLKHGTR